MSSSQHAGAPGDGAPHVRHESRATRDRAGGVDGRVDAVVAELYSRNYDRIWRMLRAQFSQLPEDLCHDAIVDALQEIRRRGLYLEYSHIAEGDLVKRSRRRAIDHARRERGRRAIAPTTPLEERVVADGDPIATALDELEGQARLRELVTMLREDEARFFFLTAIEGLSRDEAAARLGVTQSRARRLVTATQRQLSAFYGSIADGSIHIAFEERLDQALAVGSVAEALRDPRLVTHLQWCSTCGAALTLTPGAAAAAQAGAERRPAA